MIDFIKIQKKYKQLELNKCFNSIKHYRDSKIFPTKIIDENFRDSRFCPSFVRDYFHKCDNYIKINSYDNSLIYHVLYECSTDVTIPALLKSMKNTMILKKAFGIGKQIHIYIVLCPAKRYFPEKNVHIDCEHINGGFTSNDNKIFILRSEEFAKVILHEMLHHCSFINNNNFNNKYIDILKKEFRISAETQLIPNEAVVEFWATLMHCTFVSLEYNIPLSQLLDSEKQHSFLQYCRILQKQGNNLWFEKTNSYCYIIFKTILLFNATEFLNTVSFPYKPENLVKFIISHKNIRDCNIHSKNKNYGMRMMILSNYV